MTRKPTDHELEHARVIAQRTAQRRLGSHVREGIGVEDVVQEVLLRFAQLDLDEVANPDAWVVRVSTNRCADVMAAAKRHAQEPIDRPDSDADGDAAATRTFMAVVGPSARAIDPLVVAHALAELSDREKQLLLRHGHGWTNGELAEEFGYASAQSVAATIARAKARVRERFESRPSREQLLNPQRVY